jgi:hypothetical protein
VKPTTIVALALLAAGLAGCKKQESELGKATSDIAADTAVLEQVSGAASAVIRNAVDCDAVKAALPEANLRIKEAEGKLKTTAARATLDSIRVQVASAAKQCP